MELIDRQAAIDAVKCGALSAATVYGRTDAGSAALYETVKAIKALPSARPKKGKWIGKYPVASVCSECGYLIHNGNVKAFAYCPNCGAKMEVTE